MTAPGFRPTHVVPRHGLPAWDRPDPARPAVDLDPLLPVQLVERLGDWGHIVCSNGWTAWVDARPLVTVPQDPPVPGAPMARTADPRPLLTRAEEALARYRAAVTELTDGGADGETFRTRTRGLRIGLVVDGESVWLYDPDHERWVYTDGTALHTYAADEAPRTAGDPDHTPTQEQAPRAEREPDRAPAQEPRAPRAAREPDHALTRDEAAGAGRDSDRAPVQEPRAPRAAREPDHALTRDEAAEGPREPDRTPAQEQAPRARREPDRTPTQEQAPRAPREPDHAPTQIVAGPPTRVLPTDGDGR